MCTCCCCSEPPQRVSSVLGGTYSFFRRQREGTCGCWLPRRVTLYNPFYTHTRPRFEKKRRASLSFFCLPTTCQAKTNGQRPPVCLTFQPALQPHRNPDRLSPLSCVYTSSVRCNQSASSLPQFAEKGVRADFRNFAVGTFGSPETLHLFFQATTCRCWCAGVLCAMCAVLIVASRGIRVHSGRVPCAHTRMYVWTYLSKYIGVKTHEGREIACYCRRH